MVPNLSRINTLKKNSGWFTVLLVLVLLGSCRTIPLEDRAPARIAINDRAHETIEKLTDKHPGLRAEVNDAAGYFVGRVSGLKAPVVGAGRGLGVLYDQEKSSRTYMDINRFDLGAGLGKGSYRMLALFPEREALEKFKTGVWKGGLSAEAGLSDTITTTVSELEAGLPVFILPEDGATITATARLVRVSVNEDLTDTGVSEIGIPNTGLKTVGRQGNDAPRKWEHKLPFLAQRVIDLGYDLPLPYGLGLTVANVNQQMDLTNLFVGFNGSPKRQFPAVSFNNSETHTQSFQLKLDAWLFPFMNVFGMIGQVKGDFQMDVDIDGNTILNEIGQTCGGPIKPPICRLLEDKTFTLPIKTDVDAFTYGVGTTLATGYKNWFVALPMSANWTDPAGSVADGVSYTITPRGGRIFSLERLGNIAVFGGGNWLKSEYTISGTFNVPNVNLGIDYIIDQESRDNWTLLTGFNWDFDRRISWAFEYNGFIGTRESFISSFVYRF
jgi:hypothetical protein